MLFILRTFCVLTITGALVDAAASETSSAAEALLRQHCYSCHGPDTKKSGLRLDSLGAILQGGDSGVAVVIPGIVDESPLIARVTAQEPSERMPQDAPPLNDGDIAVLRAWIADTNVWTPEAIAADTNDEPSHWAFRAPVAVDPPVIEDPAWSRNPIDRFLYTRLEKEGLKAAPEADRYTLIRRASLELIGLPPTPDAIEAFVRDERPDAYERLVDGLMASPRYGERQALRWLDLARYADTNGYEKDRARSIWPYRDWVISAFNKDMSYDQFVVEQIAGDLLPNAMEDQRVATGFHRNTLLNEEGGIDTGEDWYKATVDRVNTTSAAFLGLTVGCAQCHTHKFDPISQREYFRFYAFFNSATYADLALADFSIERRRAEITAKIARTEEFALWRARQSPESEFAFGVWREATESRTVDWTVLRPVRTESENGAHLEPLEDDSILATEDIPNDDIYTVEFFADAPAISALRLEVLPDPSLPGGGPGRGVILSEGDFLMTEIEIYAVPWDGLGEARRLTVGKATHDYAAEGNGAELALDGKSDTGWSIKDEAGKPHAAVFILDEPLTGETPRKLTLVLRQDYIHQHVIGRFRVSVTGAEGIVEASGVPADVEAALRIRRDQRSPAESELIARRYYLNVSPELQQTRKRIDELRAALPSPPTTLVMQERDHPRETRIRHRGDFLQPRDIVTPGVPDVLHDLPENRPANRLALAYWLVSGQNPLIGRVTMNQLWQQVFGRGIVSTPEDFGVRGVPPSHPELLDWLAVEFTRRGWSLKAMHRLMVTSAGFRQSAEITPLLIERDPDNTLLARGPRFRLEAETIRDAALAVSGLLDSRIGGPSAYPPQPEGVTDLAYGGPGWTASEGADRFRRGLYTYWKRTAPFAAAMTFDAVSREESCTRRRRTNTPLQALTLLNDESFMEAARALALRVAAECPDGSRERIERMFLLALSRPPDSYEAGRALAFLAVQTEQLSDDPERCRALTAVHKPNPFVPAPSLELAAWTLLARAILNLDEAITR